MAKESGCTLGATRTHSEGEASRQCTASAARDGEGNQAITAAASRHRVARYFVIGGICAAMDFALFAVLIKSLGVKWYYANVVSFTLINLVHYALSIRFVFESGARFAKYQEILLTFLASVLGLLVNQLTIYVLVSLLRLEVLLAKIAAIGTTFLWNYLVRQNFIFRTPQHAQPDRDGVTLDLFKSSDSSGPETVFSGRSGARWKSAQYQYVWHQQRR